MSNDLADIFGPVIDAYTRRNAIEDGILVQLSGPGYAGDDWIPAMCKEAGFLYPIAMTATAFHQWVCPIEGDGEVLSPCQDIKGRLWDVLWMLKLAIRANKTSRDTILFSLRIFPNIPEGSNRHPRQKLVQLKAVCGPDDDLSQCITIMLPDED